MAFPVLTTGLVNSVVFGSYSNALDYLTQSQRNDRNQGKAASAAHVFTAGCFSGLVQVTAQEAHWLLSFGIYSGGTMTARTPLSSNTTLIFSQLLRATPPDQQELEHLQFISII